MDYVTMQKCDEPIRGCDSHVRDVCAIVLTGSDVRFHSVFCNPKQNPIPNLKSYPNPNS